jgi:hypothetical protein
MVDPAWRPLEDDAGKDIIGKVFDIRSEDWLLTDGGGYQTAAAETWQKDGGVWQEVVILEWPARKNHSEEKVMVRLMISPEDAMGLAEVLESTATWLMRRRYGRH